MIAVRIVGFDWDGMGLFFLFDGREGDGKAEGRKGKRKSEERERGGVKLLFFSLSLFLFPISKAVDPVDPPGKMVGFR